jgi:hypothetical protein
MKILVRLLLLAALLALCFGGLNKLLSQPSKRAPVIPECHGPASKDHPCNCMEHTNQAANAIFETCMAEHKGEKDIIITCSSKAPMHCDAIEHYGNWGERDPITSEYNHVANPMPGQCSSACRKAHCKCDGDGPVCHLMHNPKTDPDENK